MGGNLRLVVHAIFAYPTSNSPAFSSFNLNYVSLQIIR